MQKGLCNLNFDGSTPPIAPSGKAIFGDPTIVTGLDGCLARIDTQTGIRILAVFSLRVPAALGVEFPQLLSDRNPPAAYGGRLLAVASGARRPLSVNRREFLRGAASVSAAALASTVSCSKLQINRGDGELPSPELSGIEHVVVVMMENRSFDHMLGWLPNANGRQAGLSYLDNSGNPQPTERLDFYVGCSHPDPIHTYAGGRTAIDGGKMDGWLRAGTNDSFSIGYYEEGDLPLFSSLARNFTTLDNYFSSILSSTTPNRIFQHGAQTDRLSNTTDLCRLPTIWDRLQAAGVSCRYYYSNVPFLSLWGTRYLGISSLYEQFAVDAASGGLPAVSFVDPVFTLLDDGTGADDHPHADLRNGEIFLRNVITTLTASPHWKATVLVINRDEWGGFFDHVAPPRVIAPNGVDTDLADGKALLGCRVPTLIVSPFARGNPVSPRINSLLYDHTSVLKLIEWRWGLEPLMARDASDEVANLASALNFGAQDASVPPLPVIAEPSVESCISSVISGSRGTGGVATESAKAVELARAENSEDAGNESYDFYLLLKSERMVGWPLPANLREKLSTVPAQSKT